MVSLPWAHLTYPEYPMLLKISDPRVLRAAGYGVNPGENCPNSISAYPDTWNKWILERNPHMAKETAHTCIGCGEALYDMWVQCFSGYCAFCMKSMMKPAVEIKDSKIVRQERAADDGVPYEEACEEGLRSLEEEAMKDAYVYGRRNLPAIVGPSLPRPEANDPLHKEEEAEAVSFKDLEDEVDISGWCCIPF